MITDEELARWEADAMAPQAWMMDARVVAQLIAEVRRLREQNDVMREEIVQRRRFSMSPWAQHG